LQARLFRINRKRLALEQVQSAGAGLINEVKNMLLSILAAKMVIHGQLTLGMFMSVLYIVGQLNGPIAQFIGLIHTVQDAAISLERLSEIHNKEDEEPAGVMKIQRLPDKVHDMIVDHLTCRYKGTSISTLIDLCLTIPANKLTAIVGTSGSGKTPLLKLLLKFYEPEQGTIKIGACHLRHISQELWRACCGVVMQEGYIFNDTIANNIALGVDRIDLKRLLYAAEVAHIEDVIEHLPLAYNTKIGPEGMGISTGQKQRILIARAVYKEPQFLCFDEATSALDTQSEVIIMKNLAQFFKSRTTVVIAHRLSTVKTAD
jgi:ATP-binding cassette, subfamily B, bacterial